jgi:hypothetical protein
MTAWSLAITAPNRELSISRALSRWDYEHIVFKIRRSSVFRGRFRDRLVPAFPGYLWLVANNSWHTLREVFGIVDFIGHGTSIELAVNSLKLVADHQCVIPTPEIPSRFRPGDRVIINSADIRIAGQRAEFLYPVADGKAAVRIEWLMGRHVPMQVDERDLVLEIANAKSKPRRARRHRRRRNRSNGAVQQPLAV